MMQNYTLFKVKNTETENKNLHHVSRTVRYCDVIPEMILDWLVID